MIGKAGDTSNAKPEKKLENRWANRKPQEVPAPQMALQRRKISYENS